MKYNVGDVLKDRSDKFNDTVQIVEIIEIASKTYYRIKVIDGGKFWTSGMSTEITTESFESESDWNYELQKYSRSALWKVLNNV